MRIHTDSLLPRGTVREALVRAQAAGNVARDVHFVVGPVSYGSRKRACGVEAQLGTYDKHTGPMNSRHRKRTGPSYAATYDEWGWFLAELFAIDPNAVAGPYDGLDDFEAQTRFKYLSTEVS